MHNYIVKSKQFTQKVVGDIWGLFVRGGLSIFTLSLYVIYLNLSELRLSYLFRFLLDSPIKFLARSGSFFTGFWDFTFVSFAKILIFTVSWLPMMVVLFTPIIKVLLTYRQHSHFLSIFRLVLAINWLWFGMFMFSGAIG